MSFLIQSVMEWAGLASIPGFPFTLKASSPGVRCQFLYGSSTTLVWTLQEGVTREAQASSSSLLLLPSGSTVSIFHLALSSLSEEEKRLARNVLRRVRTLRIQGLLPCLGGIEYKEHIYIATEHCMPLAHYLFHGLPPLSSVLFPASSSSASSTTSCSSLPYRPRWQKGGTSLKDHQANAHITLGTREEEVEQENKVVLSLVQRELAAVCVVTPTDEDEEEEEEEEDVSIEPKDGNVEGFIKEKSGEEEKEWSEFHHGDVLQGNSHADPVPPRGGSGRSSRSTSTATVTISAASTSPDVLHSEEDWGWLCRTYSGVTPKTLTMGLRTITKAVQALHSNQLHHGNIQPCCVFVMVRTGFWRLFGFELLSEIGEVSLPSSSLVHTPTTRGFYWGSSTSNGGSAEGGDTRPSFLLGGRFFEAMRKEGEDMARQGTIHGASSSSSSRSCESEPHCSNCWSCVPPEWNKARKPQGGQEKTGWETSTSRMDASSSSGTASAYRGEGKGEDSTPTSTSSMSKLWYSFISSSPTTTKSIPGTQEDPFFPILSAILEDPSKSAAWDAWGLSRLFHLSYVALTIHTVVRESVTLFPRSSFSASSTTRNTAAEVERWYRRALQLKRMAETLGAIEPSVRLQGASSFSSVLNVEGRQVGERNTAAGREGWSTDAYVECIEGTEMYPVLECEEKDALVGRLIKELYTSLYTCCTTRRSSPVGDSSAARMPLPIPTPSSTIGVPTGGVAGCWDIFPFGGALWMMERIMANLFAYIPRRLLVAVLLLGQHLLLAPPSLEAKWKEAERLHWVSAEEEAEKQAKRDVQDGVPGARGPSQFAFAASCSTMDAAMACGASSSPCAPFSTAGPSWYNLLIGPLLTFIYSCREKTIRLSLLESTPLYAPHLSSARWNDEIWPFLAETFSTPPCTPAALELLIATTKASISAAPFLSSAVLLQHVIPAMKRHLLSSTDAVLRVNGFRCVTQVLPNLPLAQRVPLVVEVYGKGVQDGNEMVRLVCSRGVARCLDWMSPVQIAKSILPLISPLAVDPAPLPREVSWAVLQRSLFLFRSAFSEGLSEEEGDRQRATSTTTSSPLTRSRPAHLSSPGVSSCTSSRASTATPPILPLDKRDEHDIKEGRTRWVQEKAPSHPLTPTPLSESPSVVMCDASSFSSLGLHTKGVFTAIHPDPFHGDESHEKDDETWTFVIPKDHIHALRWILALAGGNDSPIFDPSGEETMAQRQRYASVSDAGLLPPPSAPSTSSSPSYPPVKEEEEEEGWKERTTETTVLKTMASSSNSSTLTMPSSIKESHRLSRKKKEASPVYVATRSVDIEKASRRQSVTTVLSSPLPPPTTLPSQPAWAKSRDHGAAPSFTSSPLSRSSHGFGVASGSERKARRISALRITVDPPHEGARDGRVEGDEEKAYDHLHGLTATTEGRKTQMETSDSRQGGGMASMISSVEGTESMKASSSVPSFPTTAVNSTSSSVNGLKGLKLGGKKRLGASLGARKCD